MFYSGEYKNSSSEYGCTEYIEKNKQKKSYQKLFQAMKNTAENSLMQNVYVVCIFPTRRVFALSYPPSDTKPGYIKSASFSHDFLMTYLEAEFCKSYYTLILSLTSRNQIYIHFFSILIYIESFRICCNCKMVPICAFIQDYLKISDA